MSKVEADPPTGYRFPTLCLDTPEGNQTLEHGAHHDHAARPRTPPPAAVGQDHGSSHSSAFGHGRHAGHTVAEFRDDTYAAQLRWGE